MHRLPADSKCVQQFRQATGFEDDVLTTDTIELFEPITKEARVNRVSVTEEHFGHVLACAACLPYMHLHSTNA